MSDYDNDIKMQFIMETREYIYTESLQKKNFGGWRINRQREMENFCGTWKLERHFTSY